MKKIALVLSILIGTSAFCNAQKLKSESGKNILKQKPAWYKSNEATQIADNILLYQSDEGAWPKNTDITVTPESDELLDDAHHGKNSNTIDNNATTVPIHFLALMINASEDVKYETAFYKGLDYLFESQYENGGWPQFYPLREGYYTAITYNDNAMMNVMQLLSKVAKGKNEFIFVKPEYREHAKNAIEKGIQCILKTQVKVNGKLTVWCAQHDEESFEPVWARNFEPPSLSGSESVDIVRFLMKIDNPSDEVITAIKSAVEWFKEVQINNLEYSNFKDSDGKKDRKAEPKNDAEPLWARFYEIETNKAIFVGRDKVIHYHLSEIERERRAGYAYYGTWPSKLINKHYPEWLEKNNLE
ncbi:pectate lyase [Carboxylicivirga caseinilyticus]|uniref:pectate lyase n=1 Tax=Carboxylicivirga caseinilyticus TaxID=3417572 RepID=UPI003D33A1AF|nr:pectate lyase [Marinilabiliaceae bacterium A049]